MGEERNPSMLDAADDHILAGRAADGDARAFAIIVRRYAPMMRAYARRILPGTEYVDDAVQEAFITAWERLPDLDDPRRLKSWLMRITSRKAIDRIRASRPQIDLDDVDLPIPDATTPPRAAEAQARVAALGQALSELPDAQREVWVLRELGEHSYEEIGEQLDIPLTTVRGLLARARKYIIVRMEQWR